MFHQVYFRCRNTANQNDFEITEDGIQVVPAKERSAAGHSVNDGLG